MKRRFFTAALILSLLTAPWCTRAKAGDTIEQIQERGSLRIGTTGDYRPLSYLDEETGEYWGFDVELGEIIADSLGVGIQYVPTSWPTLTEDTLNEELFDLAICGITITDARTESMLMSDGYLKNGKTILCRAEDADRFQSLEDLNQSDVRVMVNPGGLNEKFARENLPDAVLLIHQKNEEIPELIAEGEADVMISEIVEVPYYVQNDDRLAMPLVDEPFTSGEIGVLMRQNEEDLLDRVNEILGQCREDGTLDALYEKYGFEYMIADE